MRLDAESVPVSLLLKTGEPSADAHTEGERRLMASLLTQAIFESNYGPPSERAEARAWLREVPFLTARQCCEAVGLDYDAAIAKLTMRWEAIDALRNERIQKRTDRRRKQQ